MTTREKILLLVAFLVGSTFGYGFLRYRPASAEVSTLERSVEETRQKLEQVSWPDEPSPGPEELDRQLIELHQQHADLERQIRDHRAEFVPLEDSRARQQLALELSQLAQRCGLVAEQETFSAAVLAAKRPPSKTDSAEPSAEPRQARPREVGAEAWANTYGRPLQTLRVRCDYHALRRFLSGLEQLSWRVLVVQFQIRAAEETAATRQLPLEATLTLGL